MKKYISPSLRIISMRTISPLFEDTVGFGGSTDDKWTRRGEIATDSDEYFGFDWE